MQLLQLRITLNFFFITVLQFFFFLEHETTLYDPFSKIREAKIDGEEVDCLPF